MNRTALFIISAAAVFYTADLRAQVGINNRDPQATLDITAKTTDGSKAEGLIIPRLTGDQIKSANTKFTSLQKGAMVYITGAPTIPEPAGGKTALITASGFYYFDGSVWQKLANLDLAFLGNGNHVTVDAGAGSNGTSAGTGSHNIAVGTDALSAITTASFNLALGNGALKSATTGGNNIALGVSALKSSTAAVGNIAIGTNALQSNTTATNNTAVGYNSLSATTTAGSNTAFGAQTLTNTTGGANVGVGSYALYANTTGAGNVAVGTAAMSLGSAGNESTALGNQALRENTTGNNNTAVGSNSLVSNTTGGNNAALGNLTLKSNTTGNANTAAGVEALTGNTTGGYNAALGYQALYGTTTGGNNIGLGFSAGYDTGIPAGSITTGSNNLAVGNSVVVPDGTASNQMNIKNTLFGTGMNGTLAAPAGSIGINTSAPSNTLHVKAAANPLRLEGLQPGANTDNVVVADANGVLKSVARTTFTGDLRMLGNNNHVTQDAGVGGSGNSAGTGFDNIALGKGALNAITQGYFNIAMGASALYANKDGSLNVALGPSTLTANTSGVGNIALGRFSLNVNTTGNTNIAQGIQSMYQNTTGSDNIAIGGNSLYFNTTGNSNTAVGANALAITSGDYNVSLGYASSAALSSGNNNTIIGYNAGSLMTGGSRNVIIGSNSGLGSFPYSINDQLIIDNRSNQFPLIRGDFSNKTLTISGFGAYGGYSTFAISGTSTLNVVGSISAKIVTVNTNYNAADDDHTLIVKPTANGDITITLPAAGITNKGRMYYIKGLTSYSGNLTVNARYSVSSASYTDAISNTNIIVQSDGTEWLVIQR